MSNITISLGEARRRALESLYSAEKERRDAYEAEARFYNSLLEDDEIIESTCDTENPEICESCQ